MEASEPIDLAGNALLDVQQVQLRSVGAGHGGGVGDGATVALGVVERNQNGPVPKVA